MVRRERPTLPTAHHGFRSDEYTDKPMRPRQFLLASGSGTNPTTTALAITTHATHPHRVSNPGYRTSSPVTTRASRRA